MISQSISSDIIASWLANQIKWTEVIGKASDQDVLPSEPESLGKEEKSEVPEEGQSEEEKVKQVVVEPPKQKKKKSKEITEVSRDAAASTGAARMRTQSSVEKRGKKKKY